MLGVAISCVLLLEIPCCIEGNRPENEYGPKSQRFIVHVNFLLGLFVFLLRLFMLGLDFCYTFCCLF